MWSILFGSAGALATWIITESIAKPILRFFQLRHDAVVALALYEDQAWRFEDPDIEPPDADWLRKRKELYDATGAALVGFSRSHRFVARLLHNRILWKWRFYVFSAGSSLRTLGDAHPATGASEALLRNVRSALKLDRR